MTDVPKSRKVAKRSRAGIRGSITRLVTNIEPMVKGTAPPDLTELRIAVHKLESYLERLYPLDREIAEFLADEGKDDEAGADIDEASEYNDRLFSLLQSVKLMVDSLSNRTPGGGTVAQNQGAAGTPVTAGSSQQAHGIRRPKIKLPEFSGDLLEFQSFWELFQVSVHDDISLSEVEKFSYLMGALKGDAYGMLQGYQLTSSCYHEAVAALKERYGDPRQARHGHLLAILAVESAKNKRDDLQRVYDQCERHIRSLIALGLAEDTFGVVFVPIILSKLPYDLSEELHKKNGKNEWEMSKVREWIHDELRAHESTKALRHFDKGKGSGGNQNSWNGATRGGSASVLVANSGRKLNGGFRKPKACVYCTGDHFPDQCKRFATLEARQGVLRDSGRCFRCLESGHLARYCPSDLKCFYCSRTGHDRSVCAVKLGSNVRGSNVRGARPGASWRPVATQLNADATEFVPNPQRESVAVAADAQVVSVSFLPTAWATLLNESTNVEQPGRILLDTASSRSYITEEMCQRLNLKVVSQSYVSVGRFGSNKRTTSITKRVHLAVRCRDGSVESVVANVTPVISSPVCRVPIDKVRFPIVEQVPLAEPLSDSQDSLSLDVLIGSDFYYQFVTPQAVITCEDGPTLVGSRLGFLTAGSMSVQDCSGTENALILALLESAPGHRDPYDSYDIERFWRLEEAGVSDKAAGKDISDEQALANFYSTLKFENGRYYVTWPWKSENPELADNAKLAFARLRSTYGRLRKTPEILTQYDEIIQNQLKLGVIELAPEIPTGPVYYVPHHEVITPSKVTTKLRIVYDASSKSGKDAVSLNDCMHRGIVVLEDLCGLLIRFRTGRIGIVADIEKAFLQIGLQETERDVARFYWVHDTSRPLTPDNIVVYRFTRVFFGAVGSPSLLGSTLDAHARRVESDTSQSPSTREVAKAFRENVYSDNHVGGEDTEERATVHYQESKRLCQGASMNLREFYTNSRQLRSEIDPTDVGKSLETKVLGVKWKLETDVFSCSGLKHPLSGVEQVTKRDVVREVAQIFDPCGWFAPVVLPAKLLIQQLWKQKVDWDEKLPQDLLDQWLKYRGNLSRIPSVEIPRYVGTVRQKHQIHAFCDASLKASAVAVYLRTEVDGSVVCNLLMSKTRLAPLNPVQTIPRLELIGVELGVRLVDFVSEHLLGTEGQKFVWSDSQCALAWIKNEKLTTKFVQRRVETIRFARDVQFRFVSGLQNPADVPSRGCQLDSLTSNQEWWHGPGWLVRDESFWPANVLKHEIPSEDSGLIDHALVANEAELTPLIDFAGYSKLGMALRVVAYLFRAVQPSARRNVGPVSLEELSRARLTCEKLVQERAFPEFDLWIAGTSKMPSALQALNVYRDHAGLLRCRSRLQNSDLPFEAQNPVLLPKSDWYTTLVIRQAHEQNNHAGVAQTLAAVREKYWVVQGKPVVRRVLHECMECRRVEGGPYRIPPCPPLPEFRVTLNFPFAYTGLDNLGPLVVKTGALPQDLAKVWISLFTCALTRAVHLEVVENQSAHEFHLALRRFFATYGSPQIIVSDNASQYKTVESALKKLSPTELTQEIAVKFGVEWKHIPEVGPWMGGFYERMIGVVKRFLKKTLNGVVVSMSELRTVVSEIQFTVDSRPLLTIDADSSFYNVCPNDLLGKPRKVCFPTFDEAEKDVRPSNAPGHLVETWKRLQRLTTNFWSIWKQAYLTSLREKYSNARQRSPSALKPTVGSVVQIKEEKMPRARWLLGKIEKLLPSNDTNVRSVVVRLASGKTLTRPIKLLYPLEMGIQVGDDENGFDGFDRADVDRLRDLLQSMPTDSGSAGGTRA